MRVMNVLLDERVGGPQHRVLRIARVLRTLGAETEVLLPVGDQAFARLLDADDFRCHRIVLPRPRLPVSIWNLTEWLGRFVPVVSTISRLLRERQIDVVHVSGLLNLQAAVASKMCGRALVWHLNDLIWPDPVRVALTPVVQRLADRVVVSSREVGRAYLGMGWDRSADVLYPPVDVDQFREGVPTARLRQRLPLPDGSRVVVFVGNINSLKGIEYLIEATGILVPRIPELRVLAFGPRLTTKQAYAESLDALVQSHHHQDRFLFPGYESDTPAAMNLAEVFVLPSITESFGMVIAEAMACGRPVVATRVGGIPELVDDGVTGILVPPRDPQRLAEALLELLSDPIRARRMGESGRQRVNELFRADTCALAHLRAYQRALGMATLRSARVPFAERL